VRLNRRFNRLKVGTRVTLTKDRILQLDSNSAKRYQEREGTIIAYRPGADGPLVGLDADEEKRSEILQDVAHACLEVLPS